MQKFLNSPWPYLIIITILILILVQSCNESHKLNLENKQIKAFYEDSLKEVRIKNLNLFHRVAELSDFTDALSETIKEKEKEIVAKTSIIVQLKKVISEGVGDTIIIPDSSCLGLKLKFKDFKPFYTLNFEAIVNNPPSYNYSLDFKPLDLTSFISRNKEGIWSGYLKVDDNYEKYLKVKDFKVILSSDEFISNKSDITFLKLGILTSIGLNKDLKSLFNVGASALIKETHQIGYEKSLNSDFHFLRYGYYFSFLAF